jgi:hypothetical protein
MVTPRLGCAVLLAMSAVACGSLSDDRVELRVTGPGEALGPDSVLLIRLYGYDGYESDIEATRILDHDVPLVRLPLTIELVVPDDPHTRIVQGAPVDADDARYYFAIDGDLDGDGRICQGELELADFETTYEVSIPRAIEVPLMRRTRDVPCVEP